MSSEGPREVKAKVTANHDMGGGIHRLTFFAPSIAAQVVPGQFVHVQCGVERDFILRRPFAVHGLTAGGAFEILFNVVGKGTRLLATARTNDTIDILGPLGNGFDTSGDVSKVVLVAGGMGVAPLFFLAERLSAQHSKVVTVIGAATKSRLTDYMELKRQTRRIVAVTEDGTQGIKGLVSDVIPGEIETEKPTRIYACGPLGMLRVIAAIAKRNHVACQVALEERMACGVGVCLGCVVPTRGGYLKVCSDGPVFDAEIIDWKALEAGRSGN